MNIHQAGRGGQRRFRTHRILKTPARSHSLERCRPGSAPRHREATMSMPNDPIRYYSTNRQVPLTGLKGALLQGQAPDRGLFMPERFPKVRREDLLALVGKTYPEIAHAVLRP